MNAPDLQFIEAMERAVGSGDERQAANYLAKDVRYTVGARSPVQGIAAVIAYGVEQGRRACWDGHTVRNVTRDGDLLVVEVDSHFTRVADGARVSFPCADFYRFKDGRIRDWQVYADMSPIS